MLIFERMLKKVSMGGFYTIEWIGMKSSRKRGWTEVAPSRFPKQGWSPRCDSPCCFSDLPSAPAAPRLLKPEDYDPGSFSLLNGTWIATRSRCSCVSKRFQADQEPVACDHRGNFFGGSFQRLPAGRVPFLSLFR